jgi:hypothetical protein
MFQKKTAYMHAFEHLYMYARVSFGAYIHIQMHICATIKLWTQQNKEDGSPECEFVINLSTKEPNQRLKGVAWRSNVILLRLRSMPEF